MVEPITTTISVGALAYISKDAIGKLLGPTFDYLGGELKDFTQKRAENIGRIFQNAYTKLGDKINSNGKVPPKVLRGIINEGSFCDDELSAEYFGGILASSRSDSGRDDRTIALTAVVAKISSYQIKAHYIIYKAFNHLFRGEELSPLIQSQAAQMEIYIPYNTLHYFMNFDLEEFKVFSSISTHIVTGLAKENLIKEKSYYGEKDHMSKFFPKIPSYSWGFTCQPTAFGVELFNSVYGMQNISAEDFTKAEYPTLDIDKSLKLMDVYKTSNLK